MPSSPLSPPPEHMQLGDEASSEQSEVCVCVCSVCVSERGRAGKRRRSKEQQAAGTIKPGRARGDARAL
jgi:hypothetical protein